MKKLLTVVLALCLMMTVALAEEAPVELNWADVEPALQAGEVAGQFYTFDDIAVKIWIPDGINQVELTQEDIDKGYIGYFQPDDQSGAVSVMYVNVDGMSLEDYTKTLGTMDDVAEIESGTVNGLPCVSYTMPENDTASVAFTTEAGYVLEVTCWPASDENAQLVWGAVIASIQPAEA